AFCCKANSCLMFQPINLSTFHDSSFSPHTPMQLPLPRRHHHALFFWQPIAVYYTGRCPSPRSRIHPSLFRQNHSVVFLHSTANSHQAMSFPVLLPVLLPY